MLSGFDDEARAGFQAEGDAAEELLNVRICEKAKAVTKAICTVVDAIAVDVAHVTQDEINLCDEVSAIRVSGWVHAVHCLVRTACGSGRLIFTEEIHRCPSLFNKLFRDIDSRHAISSPRQLKRQSPVAAWHIKQVRCGVALKRLDQEICFAFCVLRRKSFPPQIEREAVKKVFLPVGANRHP